jgi:hypothetical protein
MIILFHSCAHSYDVLVLDLCMVARLSAAQGIPLPDSGLSYNPSAAAHQKAVEAAAAVAVDEMYRFASFLLCGLSSFHLPIYPSAHL